MALLIEAASNSKMSNIGAHLGLIQIVASVLTEPLITLLEAGRLYPTPGPGCSPSDWTTSAGETGGTIVGGPSSIHSGCSLQHIVSLKVERE